MVNLQDVQRCDKLMKHSNMGNSTVADPDFELRWGPSFGLLALLAFLPSVISSFFTQNNGGGGGPPGPLP